MTGICKRCGGVAESLSDPKLAALGPATFCHACAAARLREWQAREALPYSLAQIIARERDFARSTDPPSPIDSSFWHVLIADAMCAALYSPEWAMAVLDIETVNETVAEMIAMRGARFTADHPVREAGHGHAD